MGKMPGLAWGGAPLAVLVVAALLASGCGDDSPTGDAAPRARTETTSSGKGEVNPPPLWLSGSQAPTRSEEELKLLPSGLAGVEPKPYIPDVHRPDRIAVKSLLVGSGTYAFTGAKVTVQYVGYDYNTGKKFASSWDKGRPVTFTLGAGEVIPAWEEALDGMAVGDRRVVVVPPKLAQGSYPPNIPQGKTVVFILELLPRSSEAKAEPASEARPLKELGKMGNLKKPKVALPKDPPPKRLVVEDLKQGAGPAARAGDELVFHYVEVDYETGREYDSSWDRGKAFSFTLGSRELIRGWEEGLEGMRVGGRRELITPPRWAFEPGGVGNVPPNRTLIFVVDLLEAK